MSTLRIFAKGVLAPNNNAENKAAAMEVLEPVTTAPLRDVGASRRLE
jgi:hypothetical protein